MRPNLLTDGLVRKGFLELVKASDKYLFHFGTKLDIGMKQGQDIVVHLVLLTKVEVQTVPKHLRSSIW